MRYLVIHEGPNRKQRRHLPQLHWDTRNKPYVVGNPERLANKGERLTWERNQILREALESRLKEVKATQ